MPERIVYLSGASNARIVAQAQTLGFGFMANPDNGQSAQLAAWPLWAADNGCFSQGDRFQPAAWLAWLASLTPHLSRCLFAVLPDVWGDAAATFARALPYAAAVRALGYKVAIVAQPGATLSSYPWDAADCLFIGGPDHWHRSPAVDDLVQEARRRGLWRHEGRVNSLRRLRAKQAAGFSSADGTFLRFGPDRRLPELGGWLRHIAQQPPLALEAQHG